MKKSEKVLLLSKDRRHYHMLRRHGYMDILWLSSTPTMLDYQASHKDFLDGIDIALVNDVFNTGHNSDKLKMRVLDQILKKDIPYIEANIDSYTLFTPKVVRTKLNERDIFAVLNSYIESVKDTEKKPLVKIKNDNLKVLFLGDEESFSFVQSYFKKQGINVTCRRLAEKVDNQDILELASYDVIITFSPKGFHFLEFITDFSDYLEGKDHFIFFSDVTLTNEDNEKLASVTFSNTLDCSTKKCNVCAPKNGNDIYRYTLDCIMDKYSAFNDELMLNDYKTFKEILEEYYEYKIKYANETEMIREKIFVIDELEHIARIFARHYMQKENSRIINGIRFLKTDTTLSIAFFYADKIVARITFSNDNKNLIHPYYKEFNLEVATDKGKLMDLGLLSIYDDRNYLVTGAPPVIGDAEYAKVEGIYKKVLTIFENDFKKVLKYKNKQ